MLLMIFKKTYKLFNFNIALIILVLSFLSQNILYACPISEGFLRAQVGQKDTYKRIEILLLTARPELDEILNQQFLKDASRKLLSNMGIKEKRKRNGKVIEIDLSWTGINGNINIKFIPRDEFNRQNPLLVDGRYARNVNEGAYRPYIRKIQGDVIEYTLPGDVTLNEALYLIKDIDSLTESKPGRLKLSNLFSKRFKHTAVYLAKKIQWDNLDGEKQKIRFQKQIELLYLLGDMFKEKPSFEITNFEDIKKLDLPVGEQMSALKDYMEHNLNLSLEPDKLIEWFNIAMGSIREEIYFQALTWLEAGIFIKGVEELYEKLSVPGGKELLKARLPIQKWKERLKKKDPKDEIKIIKEVLFIVNNYEAGVGKNSLDWALSFSMKTQEFKCATKAILTARILREIGIGENRFYNNGAYPGHTFIVYELSDGSYWPVGNPWRESIIRKSIPKIILAKKQKKMRVL